MMRLNIILATSIMVTLAFAQPVAADPIDPEDFIDTNCIGKVYAGQLEETGSKATLDWWTDPAGCTIFGAFLDYSGDANKHYVYGTWVDCPDDINC